MAAQEVALQQKKELTSAQERTEAGKFYSPYTDIYETKDAVVVAMEVPGVAKPDIDIRLDKGVLTITGNIDPQSLRGARADLFRVQRGQFRPYIHALDEDRQRSDLGRRRGRRADGALAEDPEPVAKRIAIN